MTKKIFENFGDVVREHKKILTLCHVTADIDALCSVFSFALLMDEHFGKKVDVFINVSEMPEPFLYIYENENLSSYLVESVDVSKYDMAVVLDCGSPDRVYPDFGNFKGLKTINIDHHQDNNLFGDINIIDPDYASTGMIVYEIATKLGYAGSKLFATLIYASILGDTNTFSNGNTDAKVFKVCCELVEMGAEPSKIQRNMFVKSSYRRLMIISDVIKKIKFFESGKISLIYIDEEFLRHNSLEPKQVEGLSEWAMRPRGVKIGVYARNKDEGVKFSFRSENEIDVSMVAKQFSGGGHKLAAGCTVKGSFDDAWSKIYPELKKLL